MAAKISQVPATIEHAHVIAAHMREPDRREVLASGGFTPLAALEDALDHSAIAATMLVDGSPVCMWGVNRCGEKVGVAWLLTTDMIDQYPIAFWKECRTVLPLLLRHFDVLVNAIDARHYRAVAWAKRLGFDVSPPEPFGKAGLPFHRITMWSRSQEADCHV